jgi:hypothetical protein
MTLKIREVQLKKHLIAKHGEELGEVAFAHKMEELGKVVEKHREMSLEKEALLIEIAAFEQTLPRLEPLEQAMNDKYAAWMRACAALEDQRAKNVGAVSHLQRKLHDLSARIAFPFSPTNEAKWSLPSAEDAARHQAQTIKPSLADESQHELAKNPRNSWGPVVPHTDAARNNWTTGWRQ